MNGLNNGKKNRAWNKNILIFTAIYSIGIILLSSVVYAIPIMYQQSEEQRISKIKAEIATILKETDSTTIRQEQLEIVQKRNQFELLIVSGNEIIFSTLPQQTIAEYEAVVDVEVMGYSGVYEHQSGNKTYTIWLSVYPEKPQALFEKILFYLAVAVGIFFVFVMLIVGVIYQQMISPMRRLKKLISNLQMYKLADIEAGQGHTEYDALTESLREFTEDLSGKINDFGEQYTLLERKLQAKQELLVYKSQLVSALVHDLKTPLNISMLYSQKLLKEEHDMSRKKALAKIEGNNEKLLLDINEILEVMNKEVETIEKNYQKIDVVQKVKETFQLFKPIFQQQQIQYSIDMIPTLEMTFDAIEFRQIIHNMLSNVCQYTLPGGEFEFELYIEDNELFINAYNDADISNINFEDVFKLFYHVKGHNNHNYGSGIGMYTISNMVSSYGGKTSFSPTRNGVVLSIRIPIAQ